MIQIKYFFIFIFLFSFLNAKENKSLQIIAQNIITNNNIINANGNVLIFSKNYYISANKIKYNKSTKKLELYGNVNVSRNSESITLSDKAIIDMNNDVNTATNILLIDSKSNIWINAKSISKNKHINSIENAVISSCDCIKPAWSIAFEDGEFDTQKQWISTYNNTLYINDIPAWYFLIPAIPFVAPEYIIGSYLLVNPPYIGFSTNTERKSGLLKPLIGYGSTEGFAYFQPIYYAPAINYDFEYIPKVMSRRGYGHELKYRYTNTKNSKLDMSVGNFIEFNDYYEEQKLINKQHHGWKIKYIHNNLISSSKHTDGLLVSLQDMNDIEYKNTLFENTNRSDSTDKIIDSKVKYFYNTDTIYSDISFVNYKDITLSNSDEVFQTLPKLQIHKYSTNLFDSYTILNSLDIKVDNKSRKKGLGANISKINVPFNINSYFFNKFLMIDYTKNIDYTNISYLNEEKIKYENGNYLSHNDILSVSTDLLKNYKLFIHNINFTAIIKNNHEVSTKGDIYGLTSENENLKPFALSDEKDNINLSMNQNFYNIQKNEIFTHKINQILLKKNKEYILGNLENEVKLYFDKGYISNRVTYNREEKITIKNASTFDYNIDTFHTNIAYTSILNKDDETNLYKDGINNKSVSIELSDRIYKYYTLKYNENYDITNKIVKIKKYTINTNKKCWNFDLAFSDELIARATTTNKAQRQKVIYMTITLKPIVSLKQKFVQKESEE